MGGWVGVVALDAGGCVFSPPVPPQSGGAPGPRREKPGAEKRPENALKMPFRAGAKKPPLGVWLKSGLGGQKGPH